MTNEDEENYNNSQICWIFKEELNTDKVRDHCHVTGKFRGAAHNKCNLKLRIPRNLPIIFHNLQGYDRHIIFKVLNNFDVDIPVIPKGIPNVYPYKWVDSNEKFNYKELTHKECFYSSINDGKRNKGNGHISNEQYQHLQNVWNTFNVNTFEDFHDHYLKRDVLFLTDIFEKFISTNLEYYGLDNCHYFSAPGLSWDAMLKLTKIELEK